MKDNFKEEIRINKKESIKPELTDQAELQITVQKISTNSKMSDFSNYGNQKNLIIEVRNEQQTKIISTEKIDWNLKKLNKLEIIANELSSDTKNLLEYIEETIINVHKNVNSEIYLDVIYLTINCKKQKLNATKSLELFINYLKSNKLDYLLITSKKLIISVFDNKAKQKIIEEFDTLNHDINKAIKEFEKVGKIVDELENLEDTSPIKNIDSIITRIRLLDKKVTDIINTKLINTLIDKWYILDTDLEVTYKEFYNCLSNFEKLDEQKKALVSKITNLKEKVKYNLFDELLTFVDTKRIFNQRISDNDLKSIFDKLKESNINLDKKTLKSLLEKLESIEILLNYGNKKIEDNSELNKLLISYIQAIKNSKINKETIEKILALKNIKDKFSSKTFEFVKNKLL